MKPFLLAFLFLVAMSCKKKTEVTSPSVVNISESVYASGTVKSKNQYQVYSTVNGLIQEILVTEGDLVKKGAPLFKILNEPSKLNMSNAKLASDYADIRSNADKLKAAKVNSDLAYSKLKNDSLLFVRQANLRKQGVGSMVELEQRELAYKNSVTAYEVSLLNYRDLKKQLEFASDQAKNNFRISNALAGDYVIKADADGKVYKILKEKGEFVNTLNPVAILGDASDFILEMKVDEFDIVRLQEGQKVLFTMDSYKGQVFEAIVTKIEPLMNEQSRSFTVNAKFISKPAILYPNLSVEANIVINTKEKALTIPRNYLIGDSAVLVNKDEPRKVTIGLRDYQKVEILNGLSPSDVIYKPKP
jgi:multidrug efflux pump subunit AcrA (membrane-fusion protein)